MKRTFLMSAILVGAASVGAAAHAVSPAAPLTTMAVRHIEAQGRSIGDFVVDAEPSPAYPKGTLLAKTWDVAVPGTLGISRVDLATRSVIGYVALGPPPPDGEQGSTLLARGTSGVVVATKGSGALTLTWLADGPAIRARVAILASNLGRSFELFGLAAFDRRVIVVDGNSGTAFVFEEGGKLVAKYACGGGFYHPGMATIEHWGDLAVLTNLGTEEGDGRSLVCAFRVDRPGRLQRQTLPHGDLFALAGNLYLAQWDADIRRVGADLRLTGDAVADPRPAPWQKEPACQGITGTSSLHSSRVSGLWVVDTFDCCGDQSPSGLFICDPEASASHR